MAKPIMGTTAGATQTRIIFSNDANSAGGTIAMGTYYVDAAKLLSQINHRLYRQASKIYCLRVGFDDTADREMIVESMGNNWMVRKGLVEARKHYNKARAGSGPRGRWNDFRVNYDQAQYLSGQNFVNADGLNLTNSENLISMVAGDTGTSEGNTGAPNIYQFHGLEDTTFSNVGSATGSFGVLNEFSKGGDTEQDSPAHSGTEGSYDELDRDSAMQSANTNIGIEDGDNPPYHPELMGQQEQKFTLKQLAADSVRGQMTPWIFSPAGLIKCTVGGDGSVKLVLEVMSGPTKGVLCENV